MASYNPCFEKGRGMADDQQAQRERLHLSRLPTGIPGLDLILQGGFIHGDTYLIVGQPGTGKTTIGNQIAFAHARDGENVLLATLLAEPYVRMLAHMSTFSFVDPNL